MKKLVPSALLLLTVVLPTAPAAATDRERTVCGWIREPFAFWTWSRLAGRPDDSRVEGLEGVEAVSFLTGDGRKLGGFKVLARDANGAFVEPSGYLLAVQGNAILADQMVNVVHPFASNGWDVYVYDFRGYGRSNGRRRYNAILADYDELVDDLNRTYPEPKRALLYGISLGGAIVTHAIRGDRRFHRAVVDAAPSRFSTFGCEAGFDPADHVPKDASPVLVITGQRDSVLSEAMTRELREVAASRGATVLDSPEFGHPLMDRDRATAARRMRLIDQFLLTGTLGE